MSQETWDENFDVVVVGSGAAGFAAAMVAVDQGLRTVIVESTDKWGGSTAMSGGGMWLPNSPLMKRDGVGDSREDALTYMEATIGDAGPSTSRAHKEAFVDSIEDFVTTAERLGITFSRATDYPDYYPELPGGKIGRAAEVQPFDAKLLDGAWETSRGQDGVPFPLKTDDVWLLSRAWSTPDGFMRGADFVFRTLGGAVLRKQLVGAGAAFASAFYNLVVQKQGTPLWLSAPLTELISQDGRVTGVAVSKDGRQVRVQASSGVVLAGGGFEGNPEMRERYQGVAGTPSGNLGNVGKPIELGQALGAAVSLMDDAWWGASVPPPPGGGRPMFIVGERSMPYSLIVDASGKRFANESESYVDLGHHMLERMQHVGDNFWMIADARHARRYLRNYMLDPRVNKQMERAGWLVKTKSMSQLAQTLDMNAVTLKATIERFNANARSGVDTDFGRGNSAYDRYYGDPGVRPNPNLGPLEKAPFTAIKVVLGDLGTKGGLVTDPDARVLREDGSAIEGLYAAGNNSASVMGRTYPGAGSTIGPAAVFGLRAARHLARQRVASTELSG
ncbi:MAG: FAD-binding protein [Beutenbergiaceae bacterium]